MSAAEQNADHDGDEKARFGPKTREVVADANRRASFWMSQFVPKKLTELQSRSSMYPWHYDFASHRVGYGLRRYRRPVFCAQ